MIYATIQTAVVEHARNAADPDPDRCPCGGGGWQLSDYDSWVKCPAHSGPHPDTYGTDPEATAEAVRRELAERDAQALRDWENDPVGF